MQNDSRMVLSHIHSAYERAGATCRVPTPWPIRDACGPHARMSVIGGAGAAVCGLCGVAVPGSNVVEKYACTIVCCVLGMYNVRAGSSQITDVIACCSYVETP
jgi:hypothetical protein